MTIPIRKSHPLLKKINGAVVDFHPLPTFILFLKIWFSLKSVFSVPMVTGLILAIQYTAHVDVTFSSVAHICWDVHYGWLLRTLHANGASFFFVCLYIHTGRGIYHGSLYLDAWSVVVIILLLVMATAFLGYVLPWEQISFWEATVITNLFSTIPFIGPNLVRWIRGGFAVDNATLRRFFAFHFLFPFVVAAATITDILFVHQTRSNDPLGIVRNMDKVPFHP